MTTYRGHFVEIQTILTIIFLKTRFVGPAKEGCRVSPCQISSGEEQTPSVTLALLGWTKYERMNYNDEQTRGGQEHQGVRPGRYDLIISSSEVRTLFSYCRAWKSVFCSYDLEAEINILCRWKIDSETSKERQNWIDRVDWLDFGATRLSRVNQG